MSWWSDSRFNPGALLHGHTKSISNYTQPGKPKPASGTRWFMRVLALVSGVTVGIFDTRLQAAGALLAAVALLAGGMLTAFTHLSTLRKTYTDRADDWPEAERISRDYLDETAAHLLAGSYTAAWCVATLAVAMNVSCGGVPHGWGATIPVALATYLFLIFIMAVPRVYIAYTELNHVRPELNGTHRGT